MNILNKQNSEIKGNWIKCKKKSYVIEASKASENFVIFNPLERAETYVKKGEIVLKGLLGETWVIAENKFLERYTDLEGKRLDDLVKKESFEWTKIATKASESVYYALRIPLEKKCGLYGMKTDKKQDAKFFAENGDMYRTLFKINDSESISNHGEGDCLMCMSANDGSPDFSDIWVVDGYLFDKTYTLV